MTDVKQRGPIGSGTTELNLHRHSHVDVSRGKPANRETVRSTVEQRVHSFNVRNTMELGK